MNDEPIGKSRLKSFARFFLFGFVATSFPAVACLLVVEILFGTPRQIAGTIAILCAQAGFVCIKFVRRRRRGKSESVAAADSATPHWTRIYWKIMGLIAGGVCVTFLFFAAIPRILENRPGAGRFDRAKMEGLVAQVRNEKFSGERQFYWTAVSGTLAISTSTAAGYRILWAERAEDQNLKVIIWTNGGGHTPSAYGFAYSDVPDSLTFFSSGPNSTISHPTTAAFDVPGLHLMKRLDAHWWEVHDNSRH